MPYLKLFLCFLFPFIHNPENQTENTMRVIKKICVAESDPIGDLVTYRAMPTRKVDMNETEPFIFLNHHGYQVYPPNNHGLPFGPHPHKGFETVTFILKGDILHRDTKGHESVITEGGIQWMTAGSGVIHSEESSAEFKKNGGELEILQLWLNLPARLKNVQPHYIGLQKDSIPVLHLDQGKVSVNLISGKWGDLQGSVQSLTDVLMTMLFFKPGGKLTTRVTTTEQIFFYVVKGEVSVNGEQAKTHDLVVFEHEGEEVLVDAATEAIILFGTAEPNHEPIMARGPFVMNSAREIQKAYEEYYDGKYGEMK